jgi:hypothetical protein
MGFGDILRSCTPHVVAIHKNRHISPLLVLTGGSGITTFQTH